MIQQQSPLDVNPTIEVSISRRLIRRVGGRAVVSADDGTGRAFLRERAQSAR